MKIELLFPEDKYNTPDEFQYRQNLEVSLTYTYFIKREHTTNYSYYKLLTLDIDEEVFTRPVRMRLYIQSKLDDFSFEKTMYKKGNWYYSFNERPEYNETETIRFCFGMLSNEVINHIEFLTEEYLEFELRQEEEQQYEQQQELRQEHIEDLIERIEIENDEEDDEVGDRIEEQELRQDLDILLKVVGHIKTENLVLKKLLLKTNEDFTCSICLEQSNLEHVTGCSHFFHKSCISKWKEHSNTCPNCREEL